MSENSWAAVPDYCPHVDEIRWAPRVGQTDRWKIVPIRGWLFGLNFNSHNKPSEDFTLLRSSMPHTDSLACDYLWKVTPSTTQNIRAIRYTDQACTTDGGGLFMCH